MQQRIKTAANVTDLLDGIINQKLQGNGVGLWGTGAVVAHGAAPFIFRVVREP
jgi:hypothetical protein